MKLNGALKPRQGASKQGSSPGVVQRKYRVKRYYKVNENVVKGLPLSECGVNKKHLIKIINNSNNICINNEQQTAPLTHMQLPLRNKFGQEFINSRCSLSSGNFSTSKKDKKQNNKTTATTKRNRVSSVTTTRPCCIDFSSLTDKDEIQQTTKAVAQAAAAAVAVAAIVNNNKNKTNIEIDLKQIAVNNITTRQIKNMKINKENKNNKNNNNNDEENTKQTEVVKMTSNTSKYHIMIYKSNNKKNNGGGHIHFKEVNKFLLLIPKFYKNLNLTVIISLLFMQLKLLLSLMFSHAIQRLTGNLFVRCICVGCRSTNSVHRGTATVCRIFGLVGYNLAKIMRASQSLESSFERICFKNVNKQRLPPSIALFMMVYAVAAILLPQPVVGDDGDTFFPINGIETTTPEFDYASRGQKKFGDKCDNTLECGFPGSICDPKKKSCQCTEDLPVTNHIDKCGKEAAVNESCFFNEQCEVKYFQTECRDQRCVCRFDMTPIWLKDGSVECKGRGDKKGPETYIDPAMIGVLIGMALMFIIICVVLRLFSQARWRENRTIFNTPNPRLMNVSLLRESKLLHGQERRGSRMSVRAPSRQPSMASLRPHSPNPSLGSRSNSHGSNASATSLRSTRSNSVSPAGIVGNNSHHERKGSTYQPHQHQHPSQQKLQQQQQQQQQEQQPLTQTNIISNPVAETVTVEIIEPEK